MSANPLSRGQGSDRLRAGRRSARSILLSLLVLLFMALVGFVLWWLWQPSTRIHAVTVYGGPQPFATYATDAMRGSYFGLLPRDSVFLYPAHQIRSAILAARPEVAAVSLFREGLSGLSLKITERIPVARWCGLAPTPAGVITDGEYCYYFDASGYIYQAVESAVATSTASPAPTPPINSFAVYDPLSGGGEEPLGATLANASALPSAFTFARQLGALSGTPLAGVVVRGDEVDDLLSSGTRVTYVLGQEAAAYAALLSAKPSLDLSSGSLSYIDLRFPGKVYVKKGQETTTRTY